ncbi:MAG TPA: pantetheine-phosphate adenylyltransferase [Polyangia bacterium]|nr:pantetheine-phosphate adenylyltransferase [Polyangia bacterium]
MPAQRIAVYPGTFDPITNGHLDIILRGLQVFDHIVVAIAENVRKEPLFSTGERIQMIVEAVGGDERVEVDAFSGLLIDYVKQRGATVILRGLRALSDFEYEFQFALMNKRLAPGVETVFMMTGEEAFYVSSSLVKEVASFGGNVAGTVPEGVLRALAAKLKKE